MSRRLSLLVFAALLLAQAIFVVRTVPSLPERVASHFVASGAANGFMPRGGYELFTLGFSVGLPALLVGVLMAVYRGAGARLRVPHRDWWLAPERREATLSFLAAHACWFGSMLVLFMARVHALVLAANAQQPPWLDSTKMVTALALFVGGAVIWSSAMRWRFRAPPASAVLAAARRRSPGR